MDWIAALSDKKINVCVERRTDKSDKTIDPQSFLWGKKDESAPHVAKSEPVVGPMTVEMISPVLGRVGVSYDPAYSDKVVVDGAVYSQNELTDLIGRGLSSEDLKKIHEIKKSFNGGVCNEQAGG